MTSPGPKAPPRPQAPARGVSFVSAYLPWDVVGNEERRARWLMLLALLMSISLLTVLASVKVPELDRKQSEKLPERLAKLVMEKKEVPPPPPPPPEEKEEKPKEEPKPDEPIDEQVNKAREKAKQAMAEAQKELAAMQELTSAFDFGGEPLTKAGAASTSTGAMSRDLITSRAGKGSGGVNIGSTSSGGGGAGIAGGGKLAGAQVAAVESSLGANSGGAVRKNASGKLERTQEEIRRIMDRNNGALQAIYQRALRGNPTLKGQIVLRLVIAPDGTVTTAEILSSELGDPETEKKLATRIKAINFGAIEGVMVWDDKYTLNFFPS